MEPETLYPPGTAAIKAEYLIAYSQPVDIPDDDAAEATTSHTTSDPRDARDSQGGSKRLTGAQRKKLAKEEKKERKGANKGRRWGKMRDDVELCWRIALGRGCELGDGCRFTHDVPAYLSSKPADIYFPSKSDLQSTPPFVVIPPDSAPASETPHPYPSINSKTTCPVSDSRGECRNGLKCRFLGAHVRVSTSAGDDTHAEVELVVDEEKKARMALSSEEMNYVDAESMKLLRTRKYPRPITDAYLKELEGDPGKDTNPDGKQSRARNIGDGVVVREPGQEVVVMGEPEQEQEMQVDSAPIPPTPIEPPASTPLETPVTQTVSHSDVPEASSPIDTRRPDPHPDADTPDVPMRFNEKKGLNWSGMTYLAPLTTVGNLPFRRLCVSLGADITCGESKSFSYLPPQSPSSPPAVYTPPPLPYITNNPSSGSSPLLPPSLKRRMVPSPSSPFRKIFGIQLAGGKPGVCVGAAEVLGREFGGFGGGGASKGVDFVDLNCGCPIDLVFKSGAGSALLDTPGKLSKILTGMNRALGTIPLTVKLRTGVKDGRNTVHKLMGRLRSEGVVSGMTLHGRTRQQRYQKLADWGYIKECVEMVRAREVDEDLPRIPIFGNGDAFSYSDYHEKLTQTGVDGVMIGRGALIKPWIFTEIKEGREWDVSSRERLEFIRQYAEFGLDHFGTDTAGVNTTRRYLCEALSFQYRYVPIGLLERLPGRINDRPPAFRGRDDLETLLASGNSNDWVKISEMFLGKVPEGWVFTPKHKSNSYGNEESQG
ncbi:hypothetical protein JAAARDRAFT_42555 [Jaapia argillacea MUCL 33604]|uniref:tRNA-dihydrouridine(47) synthase [NAD(P)(+)] n=1 Tax=Jaapia argillacea MUCL 33604 TaxID=933084 RepID=A0A067P4V3_9AGAM|nr:hypothetical protein JAAARDRAFT_42555 [Jaapia argillacea MUCL 33604]